MNDLGKKFVVAVVGLLSAIYLFNPGAGVFMEIPDVIPIFGNMDEAAATTLLVASLAYFGLDVTKLFGVQTGVTPPAARKEEEEEKEKPVDGKVV